MVERCAVLLVEDDEDDYLIVRDMLTSQQRVSFEIDWQTAYNGALAAIRSRRHDVYLVDYRLGERTGLELVRDAFADNPCAPVILLTGHGDYQIDLEATALGVTDYITKQELDAAGLERSIRYAISHHQALADLARSEERYALAVRAANDGIWDWDLTSDQIYLSPRWHAILGHPEPVGDEHAPSDRWFELVHADDLSYLRRAIDAHLAGHTPHVQVEHRMRHSNGSWRWVLNRGMAIRDSGGTPTRMAGSMTDITERRAAQRQLQHDALHDPLTGLANRALLLDRLDQILQRATRDSRVGCAVLFLDIDRFKLVNDSLGHGVGDQLLVGVAARLAEALRPADTAARVGGDEFTLLLGDAVTKNDATIVAERLQAAVSSPFTINGNQLFVTASIGISPSTPRSSADDLVRNADIAMYAAKRRGGGCHAVFDDSMHRDVVDRLARENELRQAIERSLLAVSYQPIVNLRTGRIIALEALARWPPGWPNVQPREFIPIAEESGLIGALGLHVLRTALTTLAGWRRAGLVSDDVHMCVNVSRRQLDDPALPDKILAAITAADLPAAALRLEITESTLMQEPERMQRIASDVCANAVGLSLDDFGTGYSSLAALLQFPVDTLKISNDFITSLVGHDAGSDAIVRTVIALAHSLDLQVIAEGIENPIELRRLRGLGCEHGQGFLFSEPLSARRAEALLATWRPQALEGVRVGGA